MKAEVWFEILICANIQPLHLQLLLPHTHSDSVITARSVMTGNREARDFLRKLGVGGKLAQTLVERYGVLTEARLCQDPYSALFSIPGVSFRHASPLFLTPLMDIDTLGL